MFQKTRKPTKSEERAAYEGVEVRDVVCVRCRRGAAVHRDHRKNRSQGGLTTVANLQLLCVTCHTWKTEHPKDAAAEGYAVPGWAVAADYPAHRWVPTNYGTVRAAWVLYDDRSGWVEVSHLEAIARGKGAIE